ncbi:MAG: cation transporter [Nitrospirota bacterium]|nr:cation transporter [Nitrospirota bacterium]
MRKLPFLILSGALVGFLMASVPGMARANQSLTEEVRLSIPSMHCELCPLTVRRALGRLPGVLRVRASLASKTATIWIKKGAVRVRDLERATNDSGYPSSLLSVRNIQEPEK